MTAERRLLTGDVASTASRSADGARCPSCDSPEVASVLTIERVPVFCNVLYDSAEAARRAPMGTMDLASCTACGLLFNTEFDPDLVAYGAGYENALHFSPTFQRYENALARRLVDTYGIRGGHIVEVGSGDGEFLARICELSGSHGTGYDPSFDPTAASSVLSDRVEIVPRPLSADANERADLVICRHVLEHVDDPAALLTDLRAGMTGPSSDGPVIYIEVPDATYMVERTAVWDLIYEHYTYWSFGSLERLLDAAGFGVVEHGRSFGDQYLWVDAAPATAASPTMATGVATSPTATATLHESLVQEVAHWRRRVKELSRDRTVVIWGAGSKGVTFANVVGLDPTVSRIVDVNPRKHGRHVPGTGHAIAAPTDLPALGPVHVLLMNPVYEAEVRDQLSALNLDSRFDVVGPSGTTLTENPT